MANVIKHKRGSGSDPSASNLVIGELAIRTDNGKLFTKMDSGAIAEIAGGGSDIAINTLSSSSATGGGSATFNGSAYRFTLSSPPSVSAQQLLVSVNGVVQKPVAGTGQPSEGYSVDGSDIIFGDAPATGADFFILTFRSLGVSEPADNSVTNAKVASNAAIAGSKIDPTFTSAISQSDSGGASNAFATNIQINTIFPSISLNDTDSENDFHIQNQNGLFAIRDTDASVNRLTIASDGTTTILNNLDVGAGIDVTGNITSTGTINSSNITITNSQPFLSLQDSDNENDFEVGNAGGLFRIRDVDAATNRLTISSAGVTTIAGNLDVGAGIDVTGNITATGTITSTGATISGNLNFGDNNIAIFGSGNDLQLYHDGSDSYVSQTGAGNLILQGNASNNIAIRAKSGEEGINLIPDGAVELYHDNELRANTESYGFKVKNTNDSGATTLKLENNSTANNQVPRFDIAVDLAYGKNGGSVQFVRGNNYQSSAAADSEIVISPAKNDNNIEIVRITQDYVRLNSNSSGIQFNSDTAQANALNDYEEGTFSPAWFDDGGGFVSSYGRQYGQYTKIGNVVYFTIGLRINAYSRTPNSSQTCRIGNLPFVSRVYNDDEEAQFSLYARLWGNGTPPEAAWIRQSSGGSGSNHVELYMSESQTGNDHSLTGADFPNNSQPRVVISGFYHVS